jgi:hypothetical protein
MNIFRRAFLDAFLPAMLGCIVIKRVNIEQPGESAISDIPNTAAYNQAFAMTDFKFAVAVDCNFSPVLAFQAVIIRQAAFRIVEIFNLRVNPVIPA